MYGTALERYSHDRQKGTQLNERSGPVANKRIVAKTLGVVTGVLLGLMMALYSLVLGVALDQQKGAAVFATWFLVTFGTPVLVLNTGIWTYLHAKSAASRTMRIWMWRPALLALILIPAGWAWEAWRTIDFPQQVSIREAHVNLTGSPFRLAGDAYPSPIDADPRFFTTVDRHNRENERPHWLKNYAGIELAPGFTHLDYHAGDSAALRQKPVVLMPYAHDWKLHKKKYAQFGLDASYFYFHYADRIEVASFIQLGPVPARRQPGSDDPMTVVHHHNLRSYAIVRLEIDGQTMGLHSALDPQKAPDCSDAVTPAINTFNAPVKVRWQTLQPNTVWQSATVVVPPFAPSAPSNEYVKTNAVHLYFNADGTVAAQRVQETASREGKERVGLTGVVPALEAEPPCGTIDKVR